MSERTFCTTECWDCYDTTCEHFIKGLEKDRENRQELRKEIMRLNNIINELENKIYYLYSYAGIDTENLAKELSELKEKNNEEDI